MPTDPIRRDELIVAPHVRICHIDDQLIVLDLLNNRYAGMAAPPSLALASMLGGCPSGGLPVDHPQSPETASFIEALRNRGWLLGSAAHSPSLPVEEQLPEAAETLVPNCSAESMTAQPARALRIARSAICASWHLHHRSLLTIAHAVASRRQRLPELRDQSASGELIDAVSAYLHLRPFLFSARDRCLHDSLTLAAFLAAERLRARWVVGVRTRPFAAHSWVQHGSLVLNDQHERVRAYRPILVV